MPRTCFVIMPFSTTESCSEDDWTLLFEALIKPAVEGSGLEYECHRSVATRGNIVGSILQDLNNSYVVLADLTDKNANVFYELGVRHSLKERSILIAQKEEDIPFDLRAYAYHIYDWRTEEGKETFATKIAELLSEIDTNPERPDNPVSDFLGRSYAPEPESPPVTVSPQEIAYAQPLAGSSSEGLDTIGLARQIARGNVPQAANTILRLTNVELQPLMQEKVRTLNQRDIPERVQQSEIPQLAREFSTEFEPLIQKTEQFILTTVEEAWAPGALMATKIAGKWISISELRENGRYIKVAQGLPVLMAWRLLILSGAKALSEEAFNLLAIVLKEPIEVEHSGDRFSHLSLIQRHDLFHPEVFLGHAGQACDYIAKLWGELEHIRDFFASEKEYHFAVAQFLMVVALAAQPDEYGHSLYPGYAWAPEANRAMSALYSRLRSSQYYLEGIAQSIGETATGLKTSWPDRVRPLNELASERQRLVRGVQFPDSLI